jgi:AAA domain/UvrD-like helicase C-terminal domain
MPAASPTEQEPAQTDTEHETAAPTSPGRNGTGRAVDPVIEAERAHLSQSRKFLGLMRENVLSLRALGGDPVSEEYLKADLYRRAEALKDLPDTPLFFGRLDYRYPPGEPGSGERNPGERNPGEPGPGQRNAGQPGPGTQDPGGLAAAVQSAITPDQSSEASGPDGGERFHIGRRHVHDPAGRPVVIDWRAPVSRPFYRASQAEPMGLTRRRRFGFAGGELTAYEDETFTVATAQATTAATATVTAPAGPSKIMLAEIERPRSGPMRDIVATIQPDQDDIVRAGADQSICVQGAPGTGKTAVGLHRVAYLMYAHRERMARRGVLVIGPNRAFLAYIRNVLPALGETQVKQVTVADLVAEGPGLRVRAGDDDAVARIKGDARMAGVLRRALWARLGEPTDAILLARGSRRWRVPAYEQSRLVAELRERGVRYGAGREMLAHRIAHVILTRMEAAGEACDDRTHDAVRRTKQVRAAVDAIWPKVDPVRLVYSVLADREELARAAEGLLDEDEQDALCWQSPGWQSPGWQSPGSQSPGSQSPGSQSPGSRTQSQQSPSGNTARQGRGPGSARWSAADLVLIDEAADLIERTASVGHVVVDEAQDLSPMECRAIARRCETGSATVLGDLAQGTTPYATATWPEMLTHLGKRDAQLRVLEVGYRVPREILDFANRLLDQIAPNLTRAASLRHDPAALDIVTTSPAGLGGALLAACAEASDRPGSIAIIAADDQTHALAKTLTKAGVGHAVLAGARTQRGDGARPRREDGTEDDEAPGTERLTIVPVSLAKGLEFDQVVVVEPARITASGHRGTQRLYVALTRAVSRLTVLHTQPLPALLN